MRARWDPLYPPARRTGAPADASLRASDDERNAVADTLARHYAEGRLDEAEFKTRLDTAMSAVTRGELHGLFYDLPRLPSETPAPPPRHRRILGWVLVVVLAALAAGATFPFSPVSHVPWLLVGVVAFVIWRHTGRGDNPGHPPRARRAGDRHPPLVGHGGGRCGDVASRWAGSRVPARAQPQVKQPVLLP